MLRVSIIIPCYNMEKYLPTCLNSILDQGMEATEYEVIIVDDESADQTLNIARKYESAHDNFRVIDKKNAGVGAARNTGLDAAHGMYVYFLDPDDYLAQNCLPIVLSRAEVANLDILTFDSKRVSKSEFSRFSDTSLIQVSSQSIEVTDGIEFIAKRKFSNEIWWYIIKRSFLKENGLRFIEGRWMEDAILTAQLFCRAQRMGHLDIDFHRYRILPTSAMRNKSPEHYRKVIYDNANAAHVFVDLINSLDENHPNYLDCRKRLKTRQQSFVFFLLVRLMKSDIEIEKIRPMLTEFEKIDAYPLNQFLGKDYHGLDYSTMVFVFNNKPLISPSIKLYRLLTG